MHIKDFVARIREAKGWTLERLGEELGFTGMRAYKIGRELENAGPTWDKHCQIFIALVTRVDPSILWTHLDEREAFFLWIRWAHDRLPEERKNSAWRQIRERAEQELREEEERTTKPAANATGVKRRRLSPGKKRH